MSDTMYIIFADFDNKVLNIAKTTRKGRECYSDLSRKDSGHFGKWSKDMTIDEVLDTLRSRLERRMGE
jgi:hypothetical protein